jgi:hypothetical protein
MLFERGQARKAFSSQPSSSRKEKPPDFRPRVFLFGGRFAYLVEPMIVVKNYIYEWKRPEIDLNELARLRFEQGWSLWKLKIHFGCGMPKLQRHLRGLKRKEIQCPSKKL